MWGDPQEARPLRPVSLGLELAPQPLWLRPSLLPYPRTESTKPAFAGAGVGATTLKIPARICALGSPAGPWGLRLIWVCCGLGSYQSKAASSPADGLRKNPLLFPRRLGIPGEAGLPFRACCLLRVRRGPPGEGLPRGQWSEVPPEMRLQGLLLPTASPPPPLLPSSPSHSPTCPCSLALSGSSGSQVLGFTLHLPICTKQPSCCWVISQQCSVGLSGRGGPRSLTARAHPEQLSAVLGGCGPALAPLAPLEGRVVGSQDCTPSSLWSSPPHAPRPSGPALHRPRGARAEKQGLGMASQPPRLWGA